MQSVLPPEDGDEPLGYTYAGVFVRADRTELTRELADARFTGWVGPVEGDWIVLVPARPAGAVAGAGTGLEALGEELARRFEDVAVSVSVRQDRLLRLGMWLGSTEVGRYVSNPALENPDDDEAFPDPAGVEHAEAFAAACGRPEAGEELAEVLGEVLDEESEIESERLSTVLRLLALPEWLVAAMSLPRDVPGGPRASEFSRLGAGRTGLRGRAGGLVTGVTRWRPGSGPRD